MKANTTVIATETIIGDGGGGCVEPVSGGVSIEGFGGLR